jgi:TonB family protein
MIRRRLLAPLLLLAALACASEPAPLPPEVLSWLRETRARVRSTWQHDAFRDAHLHADVGVEVAADGSLVGVPVLVRSSGNTDFDALAIAALVRADPLPPPPQPGSYYFAFVTPDPEVSQEP